MNRAGFSIPASCPLKGEELLSFRNTKRYYLRATLMAQRSLVQLPTRCYFADIDADPPLR
jgi:hypothetical protein